MSDNIQSNPPLPLTDSGPGPPDRYVSIRNEDDRVDVSQRSKNAIIRACYVPPLILTAYLLVWRFNPIFPTEIDIVIFPACILVGMAFICFSSYSPLARLVLAFLYVPVMAYVLLNILLWVTGFYL